MPTVHVDLAERAYNVIIEPETLHTLGEREYHEGFAEAIKHAAIRDAAMLEELAAIDTNPISPISMGSVGLHPIEQFESISLESPR